MRIFFCFLDNCMWVCCVKLSKLWRKYLSSAVIMLKNSPKILHIERSSISSISFILINKSNKRAVVQISTVFGTVYHVAYLRSVWNGTFLTFVLLRFSQSVFSSVHQLWGSYFFSKCSKFKLDFKNRESKP